LSIKHIIRTFSISFHTNEDSSALADEDKLLIGYFLQKLNYTDLCKFLYAVYAKSAARYTAILTHIFSMVRDLSVAAEIICKLPGLTEEVWMYLENFTEQIDILLPLL
jgi:hypothetical protein